MASPPAGRALPRTMKTIFFDAVGTLLYLTESVGYHYALVGREIGLDLDREKLDRAFTSVWKSLPARKAVDGPREDDDKGWWRDLVFQVLDDVAPSMSALDRDNFFEIAYEHFAEAGVWAAYPESEEVLRQLQPRYELAVVSSFDARLRMILKQLGLLKYFHYVFVSSELGVDKPDPEIFRRALRLARREASEVLHVGDDPERDWEAARTAGLHVFQLQRPKVSLRDLLPFLEQSR
jgi:putative hydrolase of the HAD superfamily